MPKMGVAMQVWLYKCACTSVAVHVWTSKYGRLCRLWLCKCGCVGCVYAGVYTIKRGSRVALLRHYLDIGIGKAVMCMTHGCFKHAQSRCPHTNAHVAVQVCTQPSRTHMCRYFGDIMTLFALFTNNTLW